MRKTDRDRFMCIILLFKDCFDNTIYRWLKELGNITPRNIKIRRIWIQWNGKYSPRQLQLTQANIAALIIVSSRPKFNEFRFLGSRKPKFGCIVKTTDDMVQIIEIRWIAQVTQAETSVNDVMGLYSILAITYSLKTALHGESQKQSRGSGLVYSEQYSN